MPPQGFGGSQGSEGDYQWSMYEQYDSFRGSRNRSGLVLYNSPLYYTDLIGYLLKPLVPKADKVATAVYSCSRSQLAHLVQVH